MKKRTLAQLKAELAAVSSPVYGAKRIAHELLKDKRNAVINPVEKRRKAEKKHKGKEW